MASTLGREGSEAIVPNTRAPSRDHHPSYQAISGASNYVDHFAFWRIVGWLRKRHVGLNMHTLVRRYLPGWRISDGGIEMFRPYKVNIERYRYRGARIPTPWSSTTTTGSPAPAA